MKREVLGLWGLIAPLSFASHIFRTCINNYKFYTCYVRKSITQESDYGCGVACFAFVTNLTYKQAVQFLGREQSVKHGWRPSDLTSALSEYGLRYKNHYVRKINHEESYTNGTIVLIERSIDYAVGHYLVSYNGKWMDPWINMVHDSELAHAKSGFRDSLPGKAMYAIIPSPGKPNIYD